MPKAAALEGFQLHDDRREAPPIQNAFGGIGYIMRWRRMSPDAMES